MRIMSTWVLAAGTAASIFASTGVLHAQQTIRVGWTIPAEESKYWMMRRPSEFPDLGKTYNIEWTQFQGTAPMTQALAAGALDCATQAPLSLANGVVGTSAVWQAFAVLVPLCTVVLAWATRVFRRAVA